MTNPEIAKILNEMAILYEMNDVQFKPRAYEKAALAIESMGEEVKEIYKKGGEVALTDIPGVGKGIADHIAHLLAGKHFQEYERLKEKTPVDITGLKAIEGVGPKMIKVLWQKLKVRTVADLEKAAKAGKIRNLEHFGEKSEQKILKGIEFLKKSGGRKVLGLIYSEVRLIEAAVRHFP